MSGQSGLEIPGLLQADGSQTSLYFRADDGTSGFELWKTDGTAAGTTLVKDIATGSAGSYPDTLVPFGADLLFVAEGSNGIELWKTDGTAAGTAEVADINPGTAGSIPNLAQAIVLQSKLWFSADDGTNGRELFCSDGTTAGTTNLFSTAAMKPSRVNPETKSASSSAAGCRVSG